MDLRPYRKKIKEKGIHFLVFNCQRLRPISDNDCSNLCVFRVPP